MIKIGIYQRLNMAMKCFVTFDFSNKKNNYMVRNTIIMLVMLFNYNKTIYNDMGVDFKYAFF